MQDAILEPAGSDRQAEHVQAPKKAIVSGWIGSALEYYDFFIYAQAAALIFPNVFVPTGNPQVGIVASFGTFGVGYVARPLGAFVLGHWGDTNGRRSVLVLCTVLMGVSTFLVGLLPPYAAIGIWAPVLLVILRLVQGFAVGGEISGASAMILEHSPFGRRGYFTSFTLQGVQAGQILAAAIFLPLSWALPKELFEKWGWRIPFLLSAVVVVVGYLIRHRVNETPAFEEEAEHGHVPALPIVTAVKHNGIDMVRVVCMALMNAIPVTVTVFGATYATNATYGIGLSTASYLWISLTGNVVAVILIPCIGNLSDRIGRRPVIIFGCLGSGMFGYAYLYFVSERDPVATFVSAILMWGIIYQGYNAIFPAFYQELFPTKIRVTAFAVSQNIGTLLTAFLPTLYAALVGPAPKECVEKHTFVPGHMLASGQTCREFAGAIETRVTWVVGSITCGIACLAALAAFAARETFRIDLEQLGHNDAVPVPAAEYERRRKTALMPVKPA